MRKFIALIAGGLMMSASYAAPTPALYDVEVVVFENRMPDLEGGEAWSNVDAPMADLAQAVEPDQPPNTPGSLASAVAALEQDGRYHVLTYKRWRQGADERSATKPIHIADGTGELNGVFRFYMSRFLHVDVDLALQEPGDETIYRLTERRRIKTLEANYFDHPKFGALVKISPVDK